MRQKVGPKKVARYQRQTGLPIVGALVRGNTGHRVDLLLEGGKVVCLWPDGTMEESSVRWEPRPPQSEEG
jgi:hypothetical protein